jgi:GNAT superfamily N-acetyltransferase
MPLLEKHWREIAHYQDVPLEPDVERYNAMDEAGLLRCFTVRDGGRLVGYSIFFVTPNIHYKSLTLANNDVLFLHPDYRRGRVGWNFIDFLRDRLVGEGLRCIYYHVKAAHPALGRLLKGQGLRVDRRDLRQAVLGEDDIWDLQQQQSERSPL